MNTLFEFLFWMSALFFVIGLAGWWSDRYMDSKRHYDLPEPEKRAIAGESHKAWM